MILGTERSCLTDAYGRFAFSDPPGSDLALVARKDNAYSPAVHVPNLSSRPVLYLRQGIEVLVEVVDEESRLPIANATVTERALAAPFSAVTDQRGIATLAGLSDSFHDFEIAARTYSPRSLRMTLGLDPGGAIHETVRLSHGRPIRGVILDSTERPIAGATVELTASKPEWRNRLETDEGGSWHLDALARGTYHLWVHAVGYSAKGIDFQFSDSSTDTIIVRLSPGVLVEGCVRDSEGNPAGQARIEARRTDDSESVFASSADDCTFQFAALGIGRWYLTAFQEYSASAPVEIDVGMSNGAVDLTLENAQILGRVVDESGIPVAGVQVVAFTTAEHNSDLSADDGTFSLGPLPRGRYHVAAIRSDSETQEPADSTIAAAGDSSVELVAPAYAYVSGVVRMNGDPVSSYAIGILAHDDALPNIRALGVHQDDGRFEMKVYARRFRLVVAGAFETLTTDWVSTRPGETLDVGTLVVKAGRSLSGIVTDQNGKGIEGAVVTVGSHALVSMGYPDATFMMGARSSQSLRDGTFTVEGLPSGSAEGMHVMATKDTAQSQVLDVGNHDEYVTLSIVSSARMSGEVSLSDATCVWAQRQEGEGLPLATAVDHGHYVFTDLMPGAYYVMPQRQANGAMGPVSNVEIISGEDRILNIDWPTQWVALTVVSVRGCHSLALRRKEVPAVFEILSCINNRVLFESVLPGEYESCIDGLVDCTAFSVGVTDTTQMVKIGGR